METPRVQSGDETSSLPSGTMPLHVGVASKRYALALYEFADEHRIVDHVIEQAEALGRLIDESSALRGFLHDPTLDVAQSRTAVLKVLQIQGFDTTIHNFVGVIANNRRLSQLRSIVAGFASLVAARRGISIAEVSSAHRLSDLQRTQLRARLAEAGFGRVEIQESVDKDLLGGLVVRIGARLYDTSVKSRLARLSHAMKGAA